MSTIASFNSTEVTLFYILSSPVIELMTSLREHDGRQDWGVRAECESGEGHIAGACLRPLASARGRLRALRA